MKALIFGKTCLWLLNLLLRKQGVKKLYGKGLAMDISDLKRALRDGTSLCQRPVWDNTMRFNDEKHTAWPWRKKLLYLVQARNRETNIGQNGSDLIEDGEAFYCELNCKF